jgi:hypothetical protein
MHSLIAELPVPLQELDITFHRAFDMSRDLRWGLHGKTCPIVPCGFFLKHLFGLSSQRNEALIFPWVTERPSCVM